MNVPRSRSRPSSHLKTGFCSGCPWTVYSVSNDAMVKRKFSLHNKAFNPFLSLMPFLPHHCPSVLISLSYPIPQSRYGFFFFVFFSTLISQQWRKIILPGGQVEGEGIDVGQSLFIHSVGSQSHQNPCWLAAPGSLARHMNIFTHLSDFIVGPPAISWLIVPNVCCCDDCDVMAALRPTRH